MKSLLTGICLPPFKNLKALYKRAIQAKEERYLTLAIGSVSPARIPLWSLSYWYEIEEAVVTKERWRGTEEWLKREYKDALLHLKGKAWNLKMLDGIGTFTEHIAVFCSEWWIQDEQLSLVACILQKMLNSNTMLLTTRVMNPFWVVKLVESYRKRQDSYVAHPKTHRALISIGDQLASGELKTVAFNAGVRLAGSGVEVVEKECDANHWVMVKVDLPTMSIGFGDSWLAEHEIPKELREVIEWWLEQHGRECVFLDTPLPCSTQTDGVSCGVLAANTLMHTFFPDSFPLLDPKNCKKGRVDMFLTILTYMATGLPVFSFTFPKPITSQSNNRAAKEGLKNPATESAQLALKNEKKKHNNNPRTKRTFLTAFGMPVASSAAESGDRDNDEDSEIYWDDDGDGVKEVKMDISNWVDAPLVHKKKRGRKRDELFGKLTVRVYDKSKPGREYFYHCLTPGCTGRLVNLNKRQWYNHAWEGCPRISQELKKEVKAALIELAPSMIVALAEGTSQGVENGPGNDDIGEQASKKLKTEDRVVVTSDPKQPSVAAVVHRTGRQICHANLDLAITKLFCIYLCPEKCKFDQEQVEYLGMVICKRVVSFLGFANFYWRFIKDFSKIARPLNDLTKKDCCWEWGIQQHQAFEALKEAFTKEPILVMWDPARPTRLEVDASSYATGEVILQQLEDRLWHPVAYRSESMAPAERNYEIYDREMLAII
uniref:Reverse transcriptase/retrotransposon-derived protein RNase H-like domain-containing protein n=1 Tax=Moniliophthora roreri TaxID=221103 RepID=A0A0W0FD02_MONRR